MTVKELIDKNLIPKWFGDNNQGLWIKINSSEHKVWMYNDAKSIPKSVLNCEIESTTFKTEHRNWFIIYTILPEDCDDDFKATHVTIKEAIKNSTILSALKQGEITNAGVTVTFEPHVSYKITGRKAFDEEAVLKSYVDKIRITDAVHNILTLNVKKRGETK